MTRVVRRWPLSRYVRCITSPSRFHVIIHSQSPQRRSNTSTRWRVIYLGPRLLRIFRLLVSEASVPLSSSGSVTVNGVYQRPEVGDHRYAYTGLRFLGLAGVSCASHECSAHHSDCRLRASSLGRIVRCPSVWNSFHVPSIGYPGGVIFRFTVFRLRCR